MALIGRIRKNMWLVFIVIGLALAGFVVMDMMTAAQQGGVAGATTIGEVDGEPLDYREFNSVESALFSGSGNVYGAKDATWQYLVDKALVSQEAEANGFNVPTEELKSLLFGASPSPIVRQFYTDPNTGQFDRNSLLQVKQAIEGGQPLNPTFENRWAQIEKQVRAAQLQDKIGKAVAKGLYTPTWMVEQREQVNNTNVDFAVVRVPFDFSDFSGEISDSDIEIFIKGKEDRYRQEEETRLVKYAVMDVIPTPEDSAAIRDEISTLIPEFRATEDDSLFAFNNEGFYSSYYNKKNDLPEVIREVIPKMKEGEVYGPYLDNNNYFAVKLIDLENVPDSIEARHILRTTNDGTSVEDATLYIDSLRNLLVRGVADFDSLAIKNSQDPGSSFQGGELGAFAQGRMLPEFNNAVFYGSRKGGLYTVKTQVGVHLIEVQDIIYNDQDNDYQVAFIRTAVTPSETTQERLEGEMADLVANHRTLESLSTALAGKTDVSVETAGPFKVNDYDITGLGPEQTSRDIIKWLFSDVAVGEVSPELYIYTDNVNYFNSKYVIAGLEEINAPGIPSMNALKSEVENEILKQKRGESLIAKISGSDLQSIANQFETEVDTVTNITFTSINMPGMGNEPSVIAKAYSMEEGSVSNPIIGNNGVYVVKVIKKTPAAGSSNIPLVRNIMNNSVRIQSANKIMEALRDKAEISDSRSRFF